MAESRTALLSKGRGGKLFSPGKGVAWSFPIVERMKSGNAKGGYEAEGGGEKGKCGRGPYWRIYAGKPRKPNPRGECMKKVRRIAGQPGNEFLHLGDWVGCLTPR